MLQPLREQFKSADYPDLLVGLALADDAAVYRLNDETAIISTSDFFPPVVDDPYDFGAVAAANAMSDVYAMGGEVLMAINLVAFPDDLDRSILRQILRGGAEKVAEAGGVVAGGHSISDREPKYGLAVTGIVRPARVIRKAGAKAGDVLMLTKPLGAGVVTTALKRGEAKPDDVAAAVASMATLNARASRAAQAASAHAATDITGFGLLGHAHEMAHLSQVNLRFSLRRLKWLPGATRYAGAGDFPGGMVNNRDYFQRWVRFDPSVNQMMQELLWTPETSGGLLVALNPQAVESFQALCPDACSVGDVLEGSGYVLVEA